MKRLHKLEFAVLLFFTLFKIPCLVYGQSTYSTDHLLVTFKATADASYINGLMNELGADSVYSTSSTDVHYWKITNFPVTVIDSANNLTYLNDIIDVQGHVVKKARVNDAGLDYILNTPASSGNSAPPQDPYTPVPGCPDAELFCNPGNKAVKIAVVDTGISDEVEAALDDKADGGFNFINNSPDYTDDHGHGSQMAGIIGDMLQSPCQISSLKALGADGTGKISDIILAIDYSIAQNFNILNLSFGYEPATNDKSDGFFADILNKAVASNMLVIVSAGNQGMEIVPGSTDFYPATLPVDNMLTIAASSCVYNLAPFSNYGDIIDVATPGTDVLCRDLQANWITNHGTSHAAAITSAAAAQIAAHQADFDADAVYCALKSTTGFNKQINTEAALNFLLYTPVSSGCGIDMSTLADPPGNDVQAQAVKLQQNYPNPASYNTTITYTLSQEVTHASLQLFSISGRLVQHLTLAPEPSGELTLNLSDVPPGIYYYTLVADGRSVGTRKMSIIR